MNRDDYIQEVDALCASAALRSRIAALPERTAGRRRARAALRAAGVAACAACVLLALYGASVLWNMTHRGGDLRPLPPVLTAPPSTPTAQPTATPEPTPTAPGWSEGEGYSYTSEDLGIRLEFPPEWEEYFTFWPWRKNDFLSDAKGTPSDILVLKPKLPAGSPPYEALSFSFAQIYWVPTGYSGPEASPDSDVSVTLAETDRGKYVCLFNGRQLAEDHPDLSEVHTAYGTVLDGILRHSLFRVEVLHEPAFSPDRPGLLYNTLPSAREVEEQARAYVQAQYDAAHDPEFYGSPAISGDLLPVPDNWRISSLWMLYETYSLAPDRIVELYYINWDFHTATPEKVQALGADRAAMCVDGDWFSPANDETYLVFLRTGMSAPRKYYGAFWDDSLAPDDGNASASEREQQENDLREAALRHLAGYAPEVLEPSASTWPEGSWSYTGDKLGLMIEVPEEWGQYFNFEYTYLSCALLSGDGSMQDAHSISLRPYNYTDYVPELDRLEYNAYEANAYAHICWVPDGMTWPKADERDTDITLLETSGGDYVCRLHAAPLTGLDPAKQETYRPKLEHLHTGCQLVQAGFRDGRWRAAAVGMPQTVPGIFSGVDPEADEVLWYATEYVREQYQAAHTPEFYGLSGGDIGAQELPAYDNWRITRLSLCHTAGDIVPMGAVEVYALQWSLHTTTPDLARRYLSGGQSLDAENWRHAEEPASYLVFLRDVQTRSLRYLTCTTGDGSPGDGLFDAYIRSVVTGYYEEDPPIQNGSTPHTAFLDFRGLDCNSPLDELPAGLLDSLTFTGEVEHLGDTMPNTGVYYAIKTYDSPALTLKTLKLDTEWMAKQVRSGRWKQSRMDEEINAAETCNGSAEREFIWGVSPKDGSTATYIGLRLGMTLEEARALYYPLEEGKNGISYAIFGHFSVTVTDGVVTALERVGGYRVLGNTGN